MSAELESQFHERALEIYSLGKSEIGDNATRFLQKVRSHGGVAAAKAWLKSKAGSIKPTKGFLRLVETGRLDISLEATVLQPPWSALFTEDELSVARQRLEKYGRFNTCEPKERDVLPPEEVDTTYKEGATRLICVNAYERSRTAREMCVEQYGSRC